MTTQVLTAVRFVKDLRDVHGIHQRAFLRVCRIKPSVLHATQDQLTLLLARSLVGSAACWDTGLCRRGVVVHNMARVCFLHSRSDRWVPRACATCLRSQRDPSCALIAVWNGMLHVGPFAVYSLYEQNS